LKGGDCVDRKVKLASVLFTVFLASITAGYLIAQTYIWSQEVEVTVSEPVEYLLTISDPPDGTTDDTYVFTGALRLNGLNIEGANVTLWVNDTYTELWTLTASDGTYSISWTTETPGTYTFKARAEV